MKISKYQIEYQNGGSDVYQTKIKINVNIITNLLFAHRNEIKMFHFNTLKYGAHKSLDDYLKTFEELFDRFMESYQGAMNKNVKEMLGDNSEYKLNLVILTDDNIVSELNKFIDNLNTYRKYLVHTGLQAQIDEMLSETDKLIYLLKFK